MDLKEVGCDARKWMDLAKDGDQWWAYGSQLEFRGPQNS